MQQRSVDVLERFMVDQTPEELSTLRIPVSEFHIIRPTSVPVSA